MPNFTIIFMFLRDFEFLHNLFKYFLSPFDNLKRNKKKQTIDAKSGEIEALTYNFRTSL